MELTPNMSGKSCNENDINIPIKVSSMGIVVLRSHTSEMHVLTLKKEGEWVFPKGHVMENETLIDAACREVKEESGIIIRPIDCRGMVDEFCFYFEGEKARKVIKVHLFVINKTQKIKINKKEGFSDGKWLTVDDALRYLTHDDARDALNKSIEKIM